jgi:hypothetical protein
MSSKLPEFIRLLQTSATIPPDIRVFILEPSRIIRCINGHKSIYVREQEYAFINDLTFQRGDILNVFARLEALTFELFHVLFFGLSYTHSERFDDVLEFLSHSERVRLLRRWNVISNNTERKFQEMAKTRNHLAHAWDVNMAPYKKSLLSDPDTFARFQADLIDIFKYMITAYQEQQQQHDFDGYVQSLIDRIHAENDPSRP